jgi:hypothetical protein
MISDNFLPEILPCDSCGEKPATVEKSKPEGRLRDLYRVVCICGRVVPQWSVSAPAAIRAWNSVMAKKFEQK